jgi:hypothetical protein
MKIAGEFYEVSYSDLPRLKLSIKDLEEWEYAVIPISTGILNDQLIKVEFETTLEYKNTYVIGSFDPKKKDFKGWIVYNESGNIVKDFLDGVYVARQQGCFIFGTWIYNNTNNGFAIELIY